MKLYDLLNDQREVRRELLIGREIEVMGKTTLILGLEEVEEVEDGELEVLTKLLLLHEEEIEDEDDWEDGWEDDDEEEEQTNRQILIDEMDTDGEPTIMDIETFWISGTAYEVQGMTSGDLDIYGDVLKIKHFAKQGCVPDDWMEKETDELALTEYDIDADIFNVDWKADILQISVELSDPVEEVLVGKVLACNCGHYDVPMAFSVKGKEGEQIPVKLHGVYLHNLWTDAACLEEDFGELEEWCDRDERLLVAEYSTNENLQMNFYTKDYLDAPAYEESYAGEMFLLLDDEESDRRKCVLDVVPEDFDGEIEIELLSYVSFG